MKTNHRRGYRANTQRYKGGQLFSARGALSGIAVSAMADFDFTDGNRGMARSVRGAKKYVNSRLRHHENAATRRLAAEMPAATGDQPENGEAWTSRSSAS